MSMRWDRFLRSPKPFRTQSLATERLKTASLKATRLRTEQLEQRRLFAADWQNQTLRLDVDDSQIVTPADVQVLVDELTANGFRSLVGQSKPSDKPYCDVNGDNYMSPIDILHVVNGLNRAALQPMRLESAVAEGSDQNQNGYVLGNTVVLQGESRPESLIRISGDVLPMAVLRTDEQGRFEATVQLAQVPSANSVQLVAIDEVGRVLTRSYQFQVGDVIQDWNATVLNVVRDWRGSSDDPYVGRVVTSAPPLVARNLAMIHTAMFDAINAVEGDYDSYLYVGPLVPEASPVAAAAAAAHRVASSLYTSVAERAVWDATLAESLSRVTNVQAREAGIDLGEAIGDAMLAERATDGSNVSVAYTPRGLPGAWQRTLPEFVPPLLPQWPDVDPFAIPSGEAFRPEPAPAVGSSTYAQSVDEVMRLGSATSAERTADQTQIARFWADGGGTATPPGHWNRIASDVISSENLSLIDSARTMALLNLALADAGISSWDAKYFYDIWRPIDAIRLAATDGNPLTTADPQWLPLLPTPPFPSYTSGHSTFSGAGAAVLTELFGSSYSFASTSDARTGYSNVQSGATQVTRPYSSFQQAADEAGMSRIYGGIHFDFDNTAGLSSGSAIGAYVVANFLRP